MEPVTAVVANGAMTTLTGLRSLEVACIFDNIEHGVPPHRENLVNLPPYWQRLMVAIAERAGVAFIYPTWRYHEGLDRWIYLPEPAWVDPGYCEGCGPSCQHCTAQAGPVSTTWDRVNGGWMCADDNADYQLILEGAELAWPRNLKTV